MDDFGASPAGSADESKSTSCPRGHWRPAEDERLRQLVEQYGAQNWNSIAEKLQGRSGKSCRLRWFNQLDPRINRRPFSEEEEEERLLAAHRIHGNKWAMIARLFPGRTDNAVKNHWHVIMARRQREQSKLICGSKRSYQDFLICNDSISATSSSISNTFNSRKLKSSTGGFDHSQRSSTTSTVFEFRNPGKGRAMSFMESSRPKNSSYNWNFASMKSSLSNPNSTSSPAGFLSGSDLSNYKVSECLKSNSDHLFVHRANGQYSSPGFLFDKYRGSSSSSTFGLPNPRRVNVPINSFSYLSSTTSSVGDIHEQHGSRRIVKKEYLRAAASSTTLEDHPHHHHDSSIEHNKEVPFIDFLGVGISS